MAEFAMWNCYKDVSDELRIMRGPLGEILEEMFVYKVDLDFMTRKCVEGGRSNLMS